jgi:hypothetical protein
VSLRATFLLLFRAESERQAFLLSGWGEGSQMTILDEAAGLVDGDRGAHYGHPLDDFGKVTRAAAALGIFQPGENYVPELHHALYMVLVKISRLVETPAHRDSIVDGAGYFRTYEMILERYHEDS